MRYRVRSSAHTTRWHPTRAGAWAAYEVASCASGRPEPGEMPGREKEDRWYMSSCRTTCIAGERAGHGLVILEVKERWE